MQLAKRDSSGFVITIVDTDALSDDEREVISAELDELVATTNEAQAHAIFGQAIDTKVRYLLTTLGEHALVDVFLDAFDFVDNFRTRQ
jgi:hypothetical protein